MIIGSCEMDLSCEFCTSLKDKRMVVKSIIEKTRHKFNCAIAETHHNDVWQTAGIGFAVVSNNKVHVEQMLNRIIDYIESNTDAIVSSINIEIF